MNEFVVSLNNNKHSVRILPDGIVEINGRKVKADLSQINNCAFLLMINEKPYEIVCNKLDNGNFGLLLEGWYFETTVRTRLQETVAELMNNKLMESHKSDFKAPMPGLVLKIKKNKGDKVKIGEPLIILEAMKMENELRSTAEGTITSINVTEGISVEKDSIILTIEK
jgi:acetyl/propionyl-CoA carboxylase alpha subunit